MRRGRAALAARWAKSPWWVVCAAAFAVVVGLIAAGEIPRPGGGVAIGLAGIIPLRYRLPPERRLEIPIAVLWPCGALLAACAVDDLQRGRVGSGLTLLALVAACVVAGSILARLARAGRRRMPGEAPLEADRA